MVGDLIRALPTALEVPTKVVEYAIEQTRLRIAKTQDASQQAREAVWRAAFRPRPIILTERTVPQPIYVAAAIGVGRLLRIDFDLALSPLSYVNQALTGILGKLVEFRIQTSRTPDEIPAFGRPIGMIVNFTPDRAVRFDLDGSALEILPRAYRPNDVNIVLRGRPCPPETLQTIMLVG